MHYVDVLRLFCSGENPGISWDRDSIMIGKSIRISVPYRADCITIVGKGSTSKDETSVQYTKQLVCFFIITTTDS